MAPTLLGLGQPAGESLKRKHLYIAGAVAAAGVAVYFLLRASKSSAPPAVPGTLTSGSASLTIDTNVLSPSFGLPIPTN